MTVSRRKVLSAFGSAIVVGFDPFAQSWVTEAHASHDRVPRLDGELVGDPASLAAFGADLGNQVHNLPIAVLHPGSVEDIQKMVRFCAKHRIDVAARGQGHTTFGQAQARGGLVINMSTLQEIHSIGPDGADVDAGATWKSVVTASVPLGLTPPALTGYTNLSLAGTLSVGGVPPMNLGAGAQVDCVRELEVVTGKGDCVRCSERRNRDLFEAVLGGLGQCGIITRVVLDMVPAPPMSRTYLIHYSDNATFFADLRLLLDRGEFDGLYNIWIPSGTGQFIYQLNAIKHFHPDEPPADGDLLQDLHYDSVQTQDAPYLDTVLTVDFLIDFLRSIGQFDTLRHPWFDVFLPDSSIESYVADVLPSLQPEDIGPTGFMLLLILKRSNLQRPFFRVPNDTEWVFLFDILTASAVPEPDSDYDARMLARNRALFEAAREVGGTRYPIGTLDFSKEDWRRHYGSVARRFAQLKKRFDPKGILTPGPGIF